MTRAEGEARISADAAIRRPRSGWAPARGPIRPLRDAQVQGGEPTARVLFSGVLLVLFLVSIYLAHLLLAQGVARAGEIATRAALGASRWRIAQLFVVESLILGTAGTSSGLLLGAWLSGVIAARIPQYPTAGRNLALVPMVFDVRVVVSAVIVGLVIALLGGFGRPGAPCDVHSTSRRVARRASSPRCQRVFRASCWRRNLAWRRSSCSARSSSARAFGAICIARWGSATKDRVAVGVELTRSEGQPSSGDPSGVGLSPRPDCSYPRRQGCWRESFRSRAADRNPRRGVSKSQAYDVSDGYFEAWQVRLAAGLSFLLMYLVLKRPWPSSMRRSPAALGRMRTRSARTFVSVPDRFDASSEWSRLR